MIVLVMGVEGAGKTTVARALAAELQWEFSEGDDFHTLKNKEKMHQEIALTDADREPWLAALHAEITQWYADGTDAVLAASALREAYRRLLFNGIPSEEYRIVYLHGPEALLRQRVGERVGHFAAPAMLDSQLAALEPPKDAIEISISQTVALQVAEIRSVLNE